MTNDPNLKVIFEVDEKTKKNSKQQNRQEDYKNAKAIQEATAKTESSAQNIAKSIKSAFNKSEALGWAKIIKDTVNGMINTTQAQTEYIENLNLMQVAFGETADKAEAYVETIANSIGFDQSKVTRQLGVFRQISSAMRYTSETADLLSTNLSKMSMDISSLYNVDIQRAGKALESAITGQVRSIRSLTGADITQATLQQEALALGIDKTVTNMSRAEKTILIYLSLERQLANANGDVSRTVNSVANQVKIFRDQIAVAGRQLSAIFIPLLKTLLPILNGILMAFNAIVSMFLSFFGIDASSLASEFGIASGGLESIEDGLDGVTTASQKAKQSLRGFDKLNNITTPTAGTGASAGGAGLGTVDSKLLASLDEYNLQLDKMRNKATEIRDRILEWLGFSKQVNGQWKWSAGSLLKNIWTWWSKLNLAAKVFVALGTVKVITGIYKAFKTLGKYLINSKIGTEIYSIVGSIGENGLVGTLKALNDTKGVLFKVGEYLVGLIATVDGVMRLANAFKSIGTEGANLENVTDIIWGLVEAASGLMIVVGTFTQNWGMVVAGIAGIGIALGGDLLTNTKDANDKVLELRDSLNSEVWHDLAAYQGVQNLSTELEQYIDSNGRVQKSNEDRVNYILNQLNDAYGTEYKLVDGQITQNGKLVKSYGEIEKEIDKYMVKIKAQMVLEKYQGAYEEALEKQAEKTQKLDRAHQNYEETLKYINSQKDDLIKRLGSEEEANKFIEDAVKKATDEYNNQRADIISNYTEYDRLIREYTGLQEAMFNNNMDAMKGLTDEIIGDQVKVSDKALAEVDKTSNQISSKIKNMFGDVMNVNEGYKFGKDVGDGIQKGLNSKKYSLNISARYGGDTIQKKASGGFVDEGQVFIAREAGAELVGAIGNHTAVANNDQIIQGISVGVAKAMMAVGRTQQSNVVIEAKGDASGLLNFINFEQKKQDRQYGL